MAENPETSLQHPITLALIPAMEFFFWKRAPAEQKEVWTAKWLAAGGQIYEGRMIALKNDPVWRAMSGSKHLTGEGIDKTGVFSTRSIRKPEAVAFGLIENSEELDPDAFANECPLVLLRSIR